MPAAAPVSADDLIREGAARRSRSRGSIDDARWVAHGDHEVATVVVASMCTLEFADTDAGLRYP
jgi:hypothetical protein